MTTPDAPRPSVMFARRVRAELEGRGWSQRQLNDRLTAVGVEMSRATLSKILGWSGDYKTGREPTLDDLFAFAVAFPVSPVDLLADNETAVRPAPRQQPLPPRTWLAWIQGRQDLADKLLAVREQAKLIPDLDITELKRIHLEVEQTLYFIEELLEMRLEKAADDHRRHRASHDEGAK